MKDNSNINKLKYSCILFLKENWPIIVLFILGLALRIFPLRYAYYWDETSYLQNAEVIFSGRTNFSELYFRPPLISLIIAGVYFIKHSIFTAKVAIACLSSLNIIAIFLLGKEIFNKKTGIIAAAIYAFHPFVIKYSSMILTGNPSLALMTFASYFMIKHTKAKSRLTSNKSYWVVISGIFTGMGILMRPTSIIIIPALWCTYLLILLFKEIKKQKRIQDIRFVRFLHPAAYDLLVYSLGCFVVLMPYFIWAKLQLGRFMAPYLNHKEIIGWNSVQPWYFYFTAESVMITFFFSAIIIIGAWQIYRQRDRFPNSFFLLSWIIIGLAFLMYVSHKETRFITIIISPMILIVSYLVWRILDQISKIRLKTHRRKVLLNGIAYGVLLITIFIVFQTATIIELKEVYSNHGIRSIFLRDYKTESMLAAEYLIENLPENYVVYANHDYPVIAYYTNKPIELIHYKEFPDNLRPCFFLNYNIWGIPINMTKVKERFSYLTTIGQIDIYEYPKKE